MAVGRAVWGLMVQFIITVMFQTYKSLVFATKVFESWAWISINHQASCTVTPLKNVLVYLIRVCAVLVLGPVWCVGEGLVAAFVLTHVWLLPGVGPEVRLEVLQTRVGFGAALELLRHRDRQIDVDKDRALSCFVLFCWKLGTDQKKALGACFLFSNVIYSWIRARWLWRATQSKSHMLVKRAIMWNI